MLFVLVLFSHCRTHLSLLLYFLLLISRPRSRRSSSSSALHIQTHITIQSIRLLRIFGGSLCLFLHNYKAAHSPSLLGVNVSDNFVPLVDQRHQLLEEQLLSLLLSGRLLPVCRKNSRGDSLLINSSFSCFSCIK